MKKLLFAALLTAALTFAQATGGSTDSKTGKHGKAAGRRHNRRSKVRHMRPGTRQAAWALVLD
jgi:hypothetical protein